MGLHNSQVLKVLDTIPAASGTISILQAQYLVDIKLKEGDVFLELQLPAQASHLKGALPEIIQAELNKIDNEISVHVDYVQGGGSPDPLPQIKHVIAVASGKGGVGKSTIAASLAQGLAIEGKKVGILDADFYGPSIPTLMGLGGQEPTIKKVYNKPKINPIKKHGIYVMSIGFLVDAEQAVVMRGPRLGGLMKQFIHDTSWPELDYLIIDLPPGTGDIQLTMVQSLPLSGAVIVTTPQELAVIDAVKAMNMFLLENINVPIIGVVENMAWFTPEELPENKYYIFGEGGGAKLAEYGESELLGSVPLIQSIRELGDRGIPLLSDADHPAHGHFAKITENVANNVRKIAEKHGKSEIVRTS